MDGVPASYTIFAKGKLGALCVPHLSITSTRLQSLDSAWIDDLDLHGQTLFSETYRLQRYVPAQVEHVVQYSLFMLH